MEQVLCTPLTTAEVIKSRRKEMDRAFSTHGIKVIRTVLVENPKKKSAHIQELNPDETNILKCI